MVRGHVLESNAVCYCCDRRGHFKSQCQTWSTLLSDEMRTLELSSLICCEMMSQNHGMLPFSLADTRLRLKLIMVQRCQPSENRHQFSWKYERAVYKIPQYCMPWLHYHSTVVLVVAKACYLCHMTCNFYYYHRDSQLDTSTPMWLRGPVHFLNHSSWSEAAWWRTLPCTSWGCASSIVRPSPSISL